MSDQGQENAQAWLASIVDMTTRYKQAVDRGVECLEEAEEIEEEIYDGPLSILFRTGWYSPGHRQDAEPEEFEVLLTTGGPALRIVGKLGAWMVAEEPRLQYQHWGIPWTDYETTTEEDEALVDYCNALGMEGGE